jgi:hypothetical protein
VFKIESYFRHRGEDKVMQIEDNMADTLDHHESAQSSSQQDDDKKPRSGADQLRLLGMPQGVKEKTRDGSLRVTACKHRHLGWQATSIVSLTPSLLARNVSRKPPLFPGSGAAVCEPLHLRRRRPWHTSGEHPNRAGASMMILVTPSCGAL